MNRHEILYTEGQDANGLLAFAKQPDKKRWIVEYYNRSNELVAIKALSFNDLCSHFGVLNDALINKLKNHICYKMPNNKLRIRNILFKASLACAVINSLQTKFSKDLHPYNDYEYVIEGHRFVPSMTKFYSV